MTPRYYAIRINAHEPHGNPEDARKEAESLPMDEGDEWGILELVGITRRSVTTTWLDKRDIGGACEQTTSIPWSWPTLPPGHSYLNPENLTVEQLDDGWRPLCTLDDELPDCTEVYYADEWSQSGQIGEKRTGNPYICFDRTYRTRAPIPTLTSNP